MITPKKTRSVTSTELKHLEKEFTFGESNNPNEEKRRERIREIIQIAVDEGKGWKDHSDKLPRLQPHFCDELPALGVQRSNFYKLMGKAKKHGISSLSFKRGPPHKISDEAMRVQASKGVHDKLHGLDSPTFKATIKEALAATRLSRGRLHKVHHRPDLFKRVQKNA